jgi:hypothetical protein
MVLSFFCHIIGLKPLMRESNQVQPHKPRKYSRLNRRVLISLDFASVYLNDRIFYMLCQC